MRIFICLILVLAINILISPILADTVDIKGQKSIYIIRLSEAPVARYRGELSGFEATTPAARGEVKLKASSPPSIAYASHLQGVQSEMLTRVTSEIRRPLNVRHRYQYAFNGFAIELSAEEAALISTMPGVAGIEKEVIQHVQTDVGPQWINAQTVWDGTSTGGAAGTRGEGIIIGIMDTGLNLDRPSFAAIGGDGYEHSNPLGSGNYLGLCDSDPGTWVCNDKLIGYHIFTGETVEDNEGHGTHVASTAAGNYLGPGTIIIGDLPYSPAISGVAPHANIIGYDVCTISGGCPSAGSLAAIDQAVIDGVDVINYSIGSIGSGFNPWSYSVSQAFLAAQIAGVSVAESAGNRGPGASTTPKSSPWTISTGASTHDRISFNGLVNMSGGETAPPPFLKGQGLTNSHGPAPIVHAGDFGDALCLDPFPAGTWTNEEIVVCDRGSNARIEKGFNVLQGGAGGYILANVTSGESLNGDYHYLPAVHINFEDATALKAWMAGGTGHMASIAGATIDVSAAAGDIVWEFSSRGPILGPATDIIKPDLTAPGVDILAGLNSGEPASGAPLTEYGFISGTSMASPHVAGSLALLRSLYPALTPSEIKSMLMLGASVSSLLKEDGKTPTDPFDRGAGRVDMSTSPTVGLTMNITAEEFDAANPGVSGDPKTLNLASMSNSDCKSSCSWTRTVTNRSGVTRDWDARLTELPWNVTGTVEPASFSLANGASQTLTISIDVSAANHEQWYFGRLQLEPVTVNEGPTLATSHMPVAVKAKTNIIFKQGFEPLPGHEWTGHAAPANQAWRSVTHGNGRFVAVSGDGTNRVMTSTDGKNWQAHGVPEVSDWSDITFGNGLFVAISFFSGGTSTNQVMTSPDGINWTPQSSSEASLWTSLTYGEGLFVAVAESGVNQVMTSPDGINWTSRSAAGTGEWYSVTHGDGLFVAVSRSGPDRVMTSPDGITWTARTAAEANPWYSVTHDGSGLFVAVAESGTNRVMTSPDGINWTARSAAADSTWNKVTYGGGLFVAIAYSGTHQVMTSPDGINWTVRNAAEEQFWVGLAHGDGMFVAVSISDRLMTSP